MFKIKNIKKSGNEYIIEAIDKQHQLYEIVYNEKLHKLYENRLIKSFDQIKKYFITEDAGITTTGAGIGATGDQFSVDTYAPGDARNVFGGMPVKIQRRNLQGMENLWLKKQDKRKSKKKIKKKNRQSN